MTKEIFDGLGVEYTYEAGPGVHDWVFWDTYIQRAIQWFNVRKPNETVFEKCGKEQSL